MSPVVHFGLLIACSVLVGCSSINKKQWKSMLNRNELNLLEEVKMSPELNMEKSDMNAIMCWVCKKSIHEIKGVVLRQIKKEIKALCRAMKILEHICENSAYKYQLMILHLLFPRNSKQTCHHLGVCK